MTISQTIIKYIPLSTQRHVVFTPVRNFLCGLGLAYAVSNEKYAHIPLIVVVPSVYTGYQAYMNREEIVAWFKTQTRLIE
jgi:hypothetical protein